MKALFRILSLYVVLALLSWLMAGEIDDETGKVLATCGLFLLPPLAVWLTAMAVSSLPGRWFGRIAFWTMTGAGWLAAITLAQGRYESHGADQRMNLLLSLGTIGVTAAWLAVKTRSFPTWRGLGEAVAGVAILALAGGLFAWRYDARTRSIAAEAEANWAAIGLPMTEFEKTLAPGKENDGSAVFRQVLRDELGSRFYKEGTAAAEREPVAAPSKASDELMTHAMSIICAKVPPSDDFDLAPQPIAQRIKRTSRAVRGSPGLDLPAPLVPAMETRASALDADYRRILATEPPAWAFDPHDGYDISVPNFLGVRKFAQITAADALRRFSMGDQEGAARAVAAGLRTGKSLRENPTLVSLMIHVAVEGMFAPQQARLPATEDGLPSIARDAGALRTEFLRRMQLESWAGLRFGDRLADDILTGEQPFLQIGTRSLPKWARRLVNRHLIPRQLAAGALNGAGHASVFQSPSTRTLPDLGMSLHEAVSAKHPNTADPNFTRAAMRIEATLLLREQTELIRDARARLAAGRAVESRDSVVLPGLRWELTADAEKNTVATRLTGAPAWIAKNEVTTDAFWLLPLDGSIAWQFHSRAQTASRF